jgi:carboxyl-terminal processing protease
VNKRSYIIFAALVAASNLVFAADEVKPQSYYGKIARRFGDVLPRYHVLQHPLDNEISQRAWTNLVTFYDFDHSVFLKSDLDKLAAREKTLDDEIHAGDVSFGYDVYNLFVTRLRERMFFATNLLAKGEWDFSTNEMYRIRRKDAAWPETVEEANEHWRKRIKNEMLAQILNRELDMEEAAAKTNKLAKSAAESVATSLVESAAGTNSAPAEIERPEDILIKRYRQYSTYLTEPDEEAVLQYYLNAIAQAYDPHTAYMSPTSKEDFDMDMSLKLCGVGAVLSMEDGALKIVEIMPGGPIDRDGRIQEGDKIVGVKQADGAMENVMWQPMKKTIKKIRGPKDTRVTLEIIPRSDPSGLTKKAIELVRDEIKLEDQAATGRVERVTLEGVERKLGYIYLPSFYGTMNTDDADFRSCAVDVSKYLAEFNAQDVEGLVLDLRGDGGGSLREAVFLSSLFVPQGPVVQIRDLRMVTCLPIPPGNPVAFRKPMVVLTDRSSASASEIVAAHLRDVGRAIVIGDSKTHGKGTVQTVMGMGPDKYGSVKITTARFYRINGMSTQVKGVAADIVLPSLLDSLDIGEDKLPNALPFTKILPADYSKCWDLDKYVGQLATNSAARLEDDARYLKHIENVQGMRQISDRTEVPLERDARKALMKADREYHELDADDENVALDDSVAAQTGADAKDEKKNERSKSSRRRRNQRLTEDDIVLQESLNILSDLIRLKGNEEMNAQTDWMSLIQE